MYRIALYITVLMFLAHAQENPFMSPENAGRQDTQPSGIIKSPGTNRVYKMPFYRDFIYYQKMFNTKVSTLLRKTGERFSLRSALLLFGFAFLYGIIHALGPGHGKLIIGSFMLTRHYPARLASLAGGIFAATHAGIAVILYALLTLAFHMSKATVDTVSASLYRLSGVLIAGIGVGLLVQSIATKKGAREMPSGTGGTKRSLAMVSFVSGLTPCPGTLLLLVFSQLAGVPLYGLLSVLFLSIGMAVTVTVVAGLSAIAQKTVSVPATKWKRGIILKTLQVSVAVIFVMIGLFMCIG